MNAKATHAAMEVYVWMEWTNSHVIVYLDSPDSSAKQVSYKWTYYYTDTPRYHIRSWARITLQSRICFLLFARASRNQYDFRMMRDVIHILEAEKLKMTAVD